MPENLPRNLPEAFLHVLWAAGRNPLKEVCSGYSKISIHWATWSGLVSKKKKKKKKKKKERKKKKRKKWKGKEIQAGGVS
jgi:hypothetical protein